MLACSCHAVSDRTVRAAILGGAATVDAIGSRCRAGTDCGGCHRLLARLLQEELGTAVSVRTAHTAA